MTQAIFECNAARLKAECGIASAIGGGSVTAICQTIAQSIQLFPVPVPFAAKPKPLTKLGIAAAHVSCQSVTRSSSLMTLQIQNMGTGNAALIGSMADYSETTVQLLDVLYRQVHEFYLAAIEYGVFAPQCLKTAFDETASFSAYVEEVLMPKAVLNACGATLTAESKAAWRGLIEAYVDQGFITEPQLREIHQRFDSVDNLCLWPGTRKEFLIAAQA